MSEAAITPEPTPALEETPPAAGGPASPRAPVKASLWSRVANNPVVLKELRGRMRGGRAFVILSAYVIMISMLICLVYFGFYLGTLNTMSNNPTLRRSVGQTVFFSVAALELLMICFIAPALTAGAIAAERERQTLDLLKTTLLSARSLVFGKLLSSLGYIWLLLFAGVPLLSLAYLFGGIAIEEVVIALVMMLVTSLFFSAIGLFYSSFMKRTLGPTVLAYATSLVIVFGLPTLILMVLIFYSAFSSNPNATRVNSLFEAAALLGGWLVVAVNPLATGVATELILNEFSSVFAGQITLSNGANLFILSPWIGYTLFYGAFSLILIAAAVLFVKRVES